MIKYLWKIIFILEFTISQLPTLATTDYPSSGLLGCCRPMRRDRGYHEGALVRVHFLSLSWPVDIHTRLYESQERLGEMLCSNGVPSEQPLCEEGRYCTVLKYTWAVLGLLASFSIQVPYPHAPHVSLVLEEALIFILCSSDL